MARIRMLSADLIGKIAAGEVVERPAAAIKELVENSLDAGATHISVEVEEGGIASFRVTDDGCGIAEGDLRMAFERHATSKIRTETDLNALDTLGFRGEALASIAAVSRVTLTTRTRDRQTGLRVCNEGGQILKISEAGCAPGTVIQVRDLFYNVPVRRGFLKKPVTEASAITDLMAHLVLSRPDVSFRYVSDGKLIYQSPGDGKTESALVTVYGPRAVRSMRAVDGNLSGVLIRGYVGVGENARNNRSGENFFINGRMLRSPLLSGALEDACRERVMIGKFPVCSLYLVMPPQNVNVNVHPNKMEVRFRFDAQVREAVFTLVLESLRDRDAFERPVEMPLAAGSPEEDSLIPAGAPSNGSGGSDREASGMGGDAPEPGEEKRPVLPPHALVETAETVPPVESGEKPSPEYRSVRPMPEGVPGASAGNQPQHESRDRITPADLPPLRPEELPHPAPLPVPHTQMSASYSGIRETGRPVYRPDLPAGETARSGDASDLPPDLPVPEFSGAEQIGILPPDLPAPDRGAEQISALPPDLPVPMRIFGAVFDTFILIEYADHLLLVDQHAVHERLLFDRMMKQYEEQGPGQEMLVPYVVSVTSREQLVLEENRDLLEGLGLVLEPFSETEVAVRSVPVVLGREETADFVHEAIAELENGRIPGADKKRAAILQQACKHAVKGGEPLPPEVLRSLVEEMIDRKVTPTCPHGRPLVVSISHTELDRKFRRIQ